MNNDEETMEKLDSEFDHHLVDMKPYVLKLPQKIERQRCALWIKKLCDPGVSGMGPMGRKNRNMYSRLLLHMLRRGVLEGPFCHKPESGRLKTLPTYMSIYFDEPLCGRGLDQSTAGLPDWVNGELSRSDDSLSSLHRERMSSSPTNFPGGVLFTVYFIVSFIQAFLHIYQGANHLYIQIVCSLKAEMKTKVLEAKHQEEKLKMQQKHDADVQKILDRKNGEIEELKTMYRVKQKQSEETVRKLEKKVQSVVRESQVIRESKEKQIAELKKMADQSTDTLKNEWEKKLHTVVAGMEQEKFDLQKKHTENIQELLEETNHRLAKMESEYGAQTRTTEQTVRELELRVKQLSVEVEKGNVLRQKVTQDKGQLEIHIATISSELQEANRSFLDQCELLIGPRNGGIMMFYAPSLLAPPLSPSLFFIQQSLSLSIRQASDMIEDLEQTVAQLRQQLHDSEHRRQKQLRVRALHNEAEKEREEAGKKMSKLEESLREKEEQLVCLRESQRQQAQQAENALEQFKKQVEISSEKTYADMKLQMEKVEEDLSRSKSFREKQALEFSFQLEELKQRYEQQMCEQRAGQEQERTRLQQQHNAERDALVQQHQQEVGTMEREARAALHQHQLQSQEWRQRDAQTVSDLEEQVSCLRDELQQAHSQRKQQLLELGVLREEERQRAAQDQEASLGRLRTNSRLKQIEKEYGQKLAKSAQVNSFPFLLFFVLKGHANVHPKHHLPTSTCTTHPSPGTRSTPCCRPTYKTDLCCVRNVMLVRQECEMKIKGLMPAELRQELEDTISSLKSQVVTRTRHHTEHTQTLSNSTN
uniref:DUF4485 domain-containing protein n=1 Tax=Esox lucius TaxID=8010 RepID=A0AAY5L3Y7_ESOLU